MNVSDTELATGSRRSRVKGKAFATHRREHLRLQIYAFMIVMDALAIVGAFAIGNTLRFGSPLWPSGAPNMPLLLLPLFILIGLGNRAYSLPALRSLQVGSGRALLALATAAAFVVFLAFFLKAGEGFSRLAFVYGSVASAVALVVSRAVAGLVVRRSRAATLVWLVIGDGVSAPAIPGAIRIDASLADLRPDIADPHSLDRLGRYLADADRVIIACRAEDRARWAIALKGAHVHGEILDEQISRYGVIGTSHYGDHGTIIVSSGGLGLRGRALKRLFDLILVYVALVVLLPVLIVTALLIRLEDGGPILFTQLRMGRGNRLFRMYKFRSMRTESCDSAGAQSTTRDDNRVTRVGRVIRRSSVDELPQLFNILLGDMSFVGPRPHALGSLAGDKLFWEISPDYWHRHNTKPGLTGLAQVRGFRGATLEEADLVERLQSDLEYVAAWTLWRDLKILLATVRVIVHRNAF